MTFEERLDFIISNTLMFTTYVYFLYVLFSNLVQIFLFGTAVLKIFPSVSFSLKVDDLVENFLKIKVLIQKRFHLNVLEAMDLWGSLALPGPIRCLNCFWPFTYFSRDQYQNQSSTLGNENLMKEIKYRIQLAKGQSFSDLYPDLNRWKMGSIKIWNGRGF